MEIVEKVSRGEDGNRSRAAVRNRWGAPAKRRSYGRSRQPRRRGAQGYGLRRSQRYAHVEDLQRDLEAYQNGRATGAEKARLWKQFTSWLSGTKPRPTAAAAVLHHGAAYGLS